MSHGPPRAFQALGYSSMRPTNLAPQSHHHPIPTSQQAFQALAATTAMPHTTLPLHNNHAQGLAASSAVAVGAAGGQGAPHSGPKPPGTSHESLYCNSCQSFRHVSYFYGERDLKYNVCDLCRSRDFQKRKHQMERYEMYEEQQRKYKQQARFSHQYQAQAQATSQQQQQQQPHPRSQQPPQHPSQASHGQHPHPSQQQPPQQYPSPQQQRPMHQLSPQFLQTQLQTPSSLALPRQSSQAVPPSPQIKNSPFSNSPISASSMIPTLQQSAQPLHTSSKPQFYTVTPMRPQSQIQSMHKQIVQPSMSLPLPIPQQLEPNQRPPKQPQPTQQPSPLPSHPQLSHELKRMSPIQPQQHQLAQSPSITEKAAPVMLPNASSVSTVMNASMIRSTSSPSTSHDRGSQEIISLERFVTALQQETEFDRKQYTVDINPLLISMGDKAGFTKLGRAICERILMGTTFNFR
ncbi:uncharacterized protein BYT42DRAFT_330365 [Radiomyces spectabilis]|uniref:uncharacterized protein n=1 Tax=Radiomyces spectabilis TaxID=64574 RepID=UPI00222068C3|nr:uncharacterized protein BYT42DRAFT_330365 [Radiomyces spectabilis]KAI8379537.1 hypothetical protein BYT42DRAFT_330365 [Radiomyces spectabilis]